MVPTLPTLANICRVYGIGLSYFFADASEHTISITRKAHLIGGGRSQESVKHTPLNASPNSQLIVEMIEFPPGGAASISEVGRRTTSVVYVLEGRLKLDVGGTQEELDAGDCMYMESQIAAAWSAADKSRCRVLMVSPASTARFPQVGLRRSRIATRNARQLAGLLIRTIIWSIMAR
jgi:quercetin dioxygenase-like cupin family protein